jgi:Pyridoxamine 5'-phosphate oxidase
MNWNEFRATAPELAGVADAWITERHVLLLGTLRPDGWPRISAVECDVSGDDLCIGMIWQSVKALDLERDPRLTAHSLPPGRENTLGDLKLYGRARPLAAPEKRAYEAVMRDRLGWAPSEPYHCFAVDVTSAGLVRFEGNGQTVLGWRAGSPVRRTVRDNIA